jgi:hypothetical protein
VEGVGRAKRGPQFADPLHCSAAPGHDVALADELGCQGTAQTARCTRDDHVLAFLCVHIYGWVGLWPQIFSVSGDRSVSRLCHRAAAAEPDQGLFTAGAGRKIFMVDHFCELNVMTIYKNLG